MSCKKVGYSLIKISKIAITKLSVKNCAKETWNARSSTGHISGHPRVSDLAFFKKGTFDKGSSKKTFSIKLFQCFESINQSNLVGLLLLKAGPQIDDQYWLVQKCIVWPFLYTMHNSKYTWESEKGIESKGHSMLF